MAKRSKRAARKGGAWFALVLGMVLGVAAAVAVALFVTQAPMPFKDKASRNAPNTLLPDVADAPDPNIALYGDEGPAGTRGAAQGGGGIQAPSAEDKSESGSSGNPLSDAIGQIIAGLDKPDTKPAPPAPPRAPAKPESTPPGDRPADSTAPDTAPNQAAPGTQTTYFLQTGAFRSRDEAEAMLARVVLLGLPVHVETGESGGTPIHRVRAGPFKGIDEMNRARVKLGNEKIESTVVRP